MTDDERNAYRAGGRDFYEFLQEDAPKFSAVNFMKAFAKEMECPESVYEIKHTDIMAAQTQFCIDYAVIAALKADLEFKDQIIADLSKQIIELKEELAKHENVRTNLNIMTKAFKGKNDD